LRDATTDILEVVGQLQIVRESVLAGKPSREDAEAASTAEQAADFEYLIEHVPKAFDRALEGLERVTVIVRSMKEFAHPSSKAQAAADLNHAIESTLTIARNEYKYVADLECDFGELPPVVCCLGDLNQAILNIVVNAAHAIGDVVQGSERKGRISVRTRSEAGDAVIEIGDTGGGIPEKIMERIFDPFFTTKEVGKGTGQGLAIAHSVVVERHGGELSVQSEIGSGTTFTIAIPIAGRAVPTAAE
jgi:signal transduction histidine kinase